MKKQPSSIACLIGLLLFGQVDAFGVGDLPAGALEADLECSRADGDGCALGLHQKAARAIVTSDSELQTNATMADGVGESADSQEAGEQEAVDYQETAANEAEGSAGQAQEKLATETTAPLKFSAVFAEFLAMLLFVFIGCGSAMGIAKEEGSAWIFQVSLTFGLAITALAYAIGHYSGGQINCAVTLGLVIAGQCSVAQGALNFCGQILGSIVGALLLSGVYSEKADKTGGLGSNGVSENFHWMQALIGEIVGTFVLVFVVLETATNPASSANRAVAPLAIGFAVFLAHSVLVPVDGCSINPTRSLGPALVATVKYGEGKGHLSAHWIFWVGPLAGAAIAAGVHIGMKGML